MRGWFWPHIGWRRLGTYVVKRLTRLSGTPHSIAAGVACGVAISFTPFIGFHLLGGCALALLVRGNYLAAAVGTVVGNPWTFPLIWVATYKLGHLLLGNPPIHAAYIGRLSLASLSANLEAFLWPMTVGGVLLGLVAGVATYVPLVRLIAAYQEARRRRRERRRQRPPGVKAEGVPVGPGLR